MWGVLIPTKNYFSTNASTNPFNLLVFKKETDEEAWVRNLQFYVTDWCLTVEKYARPNLPGTWKRRSHLSLHFIYHCQKNKSLRYLSGMHMLCIFVQMLWVMYRSQLP